MCDIARSYFKNLFAVKDSRHELVLEHIHPSISSGDNELLIALVTKRELYEALFYMHLDKSRDPDDFNPSFFQIFWDMCEEDIFVVVTLWMERGSFPSSIEEVFGKCVSEKKSAFIEGWLILDNALIAIETIHALKRKTKGNKRNMALKIDISKAYDMVDWSFLKGVLPRMGFENRWIHWVMMCATSVKYFVLVNADKVHEGE
ncbi:uncharacterized protein LOC127104326 [Lathyrus oleraceus]|uniref:uncharacterized protein LOC127104326 n=1 Tax=Pisum sativum TaxID=3888 RepID=UPI0021D1F2AF|nr:uncharacterized protein LOC127104326 [Pisum sativum]